MVNLENGRGFYMFLKRWWQLLLLIVVSALAVWIAPEALGWDRTVVTQTCVAACSTVFVGILGRNGGRDQAEAARRQSEERELRAREGQLIDRQAIAVGHLCSDDPVMASAGVTEMVGLVLDWAALTNDLWKFDHREGMGERWRLRALDLVKLSYRTYLSTEEREPNRGPARDCTENLVVRARESGLYDLSKHLSGEVPWMDDMTPFASLTFTRSFLRGAYLSSADLVDAELWFADLRDANLCYAHLEHSRLGNARLEGAKLEHAHLEDADLRGASYDTSTTLPDGFDPDAHGMVESVNIHETDDI